MGDRHPPNAERDRIAGRLIDTIEGWRDGMLSDQEIVAVLCTRVRDLLSLPAAHPPQHAWVELMCGCHVQPIEATAVGDCRTCVHHGAQYVQVTRRF